MHYIFILFSIFCIVHQILFILFLHSFQFPVFEMCFSRYEIVCFIYKTYFYIIYFLFKKYTTSNNLHSDVFEPKTTFLGICHIYNCNTSQTTNQTFRFFASFSNTSSFQDTHEWFSIYRKEEKNQFVSIQSSTIRKSVE